MRELLQVWPFKTFVEMRKPMPVIQSSITINVPIERVFNLLDDPTSASKWFPGVRDVVGVTRTKERVGDKWTLKYAVLGVTVDVEQEVTDWEKNARIQLKMVGVFVGSLTMTVSLDGDSTKVTQEFDYEVKGGVLGKVANKLAIERINDKNAKRSMEDLKDLLESDSQ